MCIASPALGAQFLGRLTPEHFATEANRRALEWLRGHLEDPLEDIPREDEALLAQINRLVQLSEPASESAMTMNWRRLEVRRIERAMRDADGDELIRLQRDRANMAEAIARGTPVSR